MSAKHCSSNRLIIVCGLSFAGKSILGNAICAEFGFPQVDVDETKLDLYGPGIDDEDLSPEQWARIYRETDDRIVSYLQDGDSVVDASRNFRKDERNRAREIAERMKVEAVVIYVSTPESLIRRRWTENRDKQTRRDVSDEAFEEIICIMEPPTADEKALVFHHNDNIMSWLAEHAGYLAEKQCGSG